MTGGGSAGHVTPNIALMPKLRELGYEIQYIGTKDGIERKIIENENIKYHVIESGKLRRYFDVKNFSDPFKVLKGISEAVNIMKKERPDIVFSKGGFVSVPVVIGAKRCGIPVVAHESDITPGLANKIASFYCDKICVTFPETLDKVKKDKGILTGTPIRKSILEGSKILGIRECRFDDNKPILLAAGGSLGSAFINNMIRNSLKRLTCSYNVVHICGKGNIESNLKNLPGYRQYEYIDEKLPDVMNAADMIVSRAGANFIFEILSLRKPNLLIPLSRKSSRGDQILNAASFKKSGYSIVMQEEELNEDIFVEKINSLYDNKQKYIRNMTKSLSKNGVDAIIEVIKEYTL